jgi:hypothetical protein
MHSFDVEIYGAHSYHVPLKNFSPLEVLGTTWNTERCSELCALFQSREWTGYSQSTPLHTNNDTCTILICDFSKEQHELPEDDKHCAIETRRSLLNVLV